MKYRNGIQSNNLHTEAITFQEYSICHKIVISMNDVLQHNKSNSVCYLIKQRNINNIVAIIITIFVLFFNIIDSSGCDVLSVRLL